MRWSSTSLGGFIAAAVAAVLGCSSSTEGAAPAGAGGGGGVDAAAPLTPEAGTGLGGASASGGAGGGANGTCGDGKVDPPEQCDDGNRVNDDGCDDSCRLNCIPGPVGDSLCSDGNFCNGRETCSARHLCAPATDPPAEGAACGDNSACVSGVCQLIAKCGDGLLVAPEECDPPDGAGCGVDCRFTCVSSDPARACLTVDSCAGVLACQDSTHTCLPGPALPDLSPCGTASSGSVCLNARCTTQWCGNQKVDSGEECDDGNLVNGDGCDACRFSCMPNDPTRKCATLNPCMTAGTCEAGTHRCTPNVPKAAGTTCGSGENCIQGNCIGIACGDGVTALGAEACDDGNIVNGDGCDTDCSVSCGNAATDCKSGNPCRAPSCSASRCASVPAVAKEGAPCSTGGGSATCHSGACTSSTCGDGNVDAGEECDLGAGNGPNAGCEVGCTLSCVTNPSCNDGDPCNGDETCAPVTGGKRCASGVPKADGTSCGTGKICLRGGCRLTGCGDRFTDVVAKEECDPPNTVGCDAQCRAVTVCDVTGTWAARVTISVTWGDGEILSLLSGDLTVWEELSVTQAGLSLSGTSRACGVDIPDFSSAVVPEWYGFRFADKAFDESKAAPFSGTVSNHSPGADVQIGSIPLLIGLTMTDPGGAWPSAADIVAGVIAAPSDDDGDGLRGITATVKTGSLPGDGGTFADPLVNGNTVPLGRASSMDLALRTVLSRSSVLESCTKMSGRADVSSLDDHVLGCMRDDGAPCTDEEWNVPDAVKPVYTIGTATYSAVKIAAGATCTDVRRALP